MTLTEYKTRYVHCFKDEEGEYHGLCQDWYSRGVLRYQAQYRHGKWHGEYKFFREDGSLAYHRWYEHGKEVLNFLAGDKYPTTEEDRLIFKLTYQGEFIPN